MSAAVLAMVRSSPFAKRIRAGIDMRIGVIGACEDQDSYDLRNQFATNVFGTLHIIQLSLPHFRAQNRGRYLIFSSTSGALGVPGLGPYCATKYAVEGLIESMLYEVDAFNIKATLVEPGHVRLDEPDLGTGENRLKRYGHFYVKAASAPYAGASSPAGHTKRVIGWLNDRQPTSAVKSSELVWQLGHCAYPPLRLLLGSYAVESIRDRLRSIIEEVCGLVPSKGFCKANADGRSRIGSILAFQFRQKMKRGRRSGSGRQNTSRTKSKIKMMKQCRMATEIRHLGAPHRYP